ncbi:hypothetical protein [Klebsiella pneumoniae IS39]|nr:hypothetical protein [Klebsiella pneumoniae IS39]
MLHIGRRTLQTVQAQQAQTENIFADGGFIFIPGYSPPPDAAGRPDRR